MSYEGYYQKWCTQGHLTTENENLIHPKNRCACGSEFAFVNPVDDTNVDSYGYIIPEVMSSAIPCTCEGCGNKHNKEEARYKIPDENTPRYRRGHQGEAEWVMLGKRK